MSFNLLPPDLTPREEIIKISNFIKRISVVGYSVVLISAAIFVGAFFVLSNQLKTSISEQENWKVQISSLEETEQRLVLIKDRLEKVSKILKSATAADEIESLSQTQSILPEGVILREAKLSTGNSEMRLLTQNSSSTAQLLAKLLASGIYKKVELKALDFNQTVGFSLELNLIN